MVSSLDKIRLKSQTFASSSQPLPLNSSGQQNLIYNHKFSSVKALFLNCGGTARTENASGSSANGNLDAYNVAGDSGGYSFSVGQVAIPQRALSVANNKNGMIQMLRQAFGSIFDKNTAMSINSAEWNNSNSNAITTLMLLLNSGLAFPLKN